MKRLINWIGSALSDDLTPSSKRLIAFLIAATYIYCDVYHVMKTGEYSVTNKIIDGVMVLVLLGLATLPQILQLVTSLKGGTVPAATEPTNEQPKQ